MSSVEHKRHRQYNRCNQRQCETSLFRAPERQQNQDERANQRREEDLLVELLIPLQVEPKRNVHLLPALSQFARIVLVRIVAIVELKLIQDFIAGVNFN
jgi:hypothetical protein